MQKIRWSPVARRSNMRDWMQRLWCAKLRSVHWSNTIRFWETINNAVSLMVNDYLHINMQSKNSSDCPISNTVWKSLLLHSLQNWKCQSVEVIKTIESAETRNIAIAKMNNVQKCLNRWRKSLFYFSHLMWFLCKELLTFADLFWVYVLRRVLPCLIPWIFSQYFTFELLQYYAAT